MMPENNSSDLTHQNSEKFPETAEPEVSQYQKRPVDLNQFSARSRLDNTTNNQEQPAQSILRKSSSFNSGKLNPKAKKILTGSILVLVLLFSIFGSLAFYTFGVVTQLRQQAAVSKATAQEAYVLFKGQNLPATQEKVTQLTADLETIQKSYSKLAIYNYLPFARTYYQDGQHGLTAAAAGLAAANKALASITPYADVLGFSGENSFQGGTAEDRLKVILETLDKVSPELDAIAADLKIVEAELKEINPNHYPTEVKGIKVRDQITNVQAVASGAVTSLTEFRPVIEQLPSIAGSKGARKKYLVLFQNDNELRPTGGFLTAYAIINVENGKVEAEKSDDIYELDKKFKKTQAIPAELGRYLTTEKFWNLRDMNTSPDFKVSMDQFYTNYKGIRGEPENIDGIIAVDTHFLTSLMKVLGPIEVPGYGTFSAENDKRCDCPEIIYVLSEIITRPTPYLREDRKGILGPLMRSLLTKAYAAPKQQWPSLFEQGLLAVQGRNLQFYFFDEKDQSAAELAKAAGRMLPPEDNEDFLAIVNANLGGAKSNLFVTYDVKQVITEPSEGIIEKTVEITYKNPRHADNCNLEAGLLCLNSTLRDWTRIYVPEGSQLLSAQGFTEEAKTYTENGFTVFDGFFILEPKSSAKIVLKYTVPYTNTKEYVGHVWKQGGIADFEMLFDVTGGEEKVTISKDTTYKTSF
jgi:hypothetical protein